MHNDQSTYTILHIGLGAFHRAHQAVYLNQLIKLGDKRWSITGGNIRSDSPELIAALQRQNGQYTLETITPNGVHAYELISSISKVLSWDENLSELVQAGAALNTRIISFTVTEAGYYLSGHLQLDLNIPEIVRDLASIKNKRAGSTIYAALYAILKLRMAQGNGPITLLNCDNLRHNGDQVRAGFFQFIDATGDHALLSWVTQNASFPNSMVDRITPRTPVEVASRVQTATGRTDQAAIMAESFIQWVIEDKFIAGRPSWERVGAQMVESVAPFEEAKIRLLNATHSCIAWAGTLVGHTYIHEGTLDAQVRLIAYNYATDDAIPALENSPLNLFDYRDVVLDRFSNPAICDTNQRVAMDGFSKIPGFILPTIADRLSKNKSGAAVMMLPALFLAYLEKWHLGLLPYEYHDQAMAPAAGHAICAANDPVLAFCQEPSLWGSLAGAPELVNAMRLARDRVDKFVLAKN
jgi:D-arabinitol 4-dehydrogenase